MRRSFGARIALSLIGLWFPSNSGFLFAVPPCPMHQVAAADNTADLHAHHSHSDSAHHHSGPGHTSHGCDCAGRCGNTSPTVALSVSLPPISIGPAFRVVPESRTDARGLYGVRHLPFATGPPSDLHA